MKKTSFILATLFLSLALSGCGRQEAPAANNMDDNQQSNSSVEATSSRASSSSLKANQGSSSASSTRALAGQEDLCQKYQEATIKTNFGDITIEFYCNDSPITVNNFMNLAAKGFYDDIKFHRIIKDFMVQVGDPNTKGSDVSKYGQGGPGYAFQDEFNSHKLIRGSVAMANTGQPVSNGSQIFIVTKEATPWLDGKHTNFGRVVSGMKVVDKIEDVETNEAGLPVKDVIIKSIELK